MSGSGWRAMGSASFWSSAALLLAGAEGGGAGFAAEAGPAGTTALVVWPLTVQMPMSVAKAKTKQAFMASLVATFHRSSLSGRSCFEHFWDNTRHSDKSSDREQDLGTKIEISFGREPPALDSIALHGTA